MSQIPDPGANGPDSDTLIGLVDCILTTEDFDSAASWICQPERLQVFAANLDDPDWARSAATMFARAVWNVTPLPGNRFRPRPLPKPERNSPCPCGSGRKYKHCCRDLQLPEAPLDAIWFIVLELLDDAQTEQAIKTRAVPVPALAAMAGDHLEQHRAGQALTLLEPLFEGNLRDLGSRHEVAFDLLCDAYNALGAEDKKLTLMDRVANNASGILRASAWQRRATVYMDNGDAQAAWDAFKHAQRTAPKDPALAPLELSLLAGEDRFEQASERARFWQTKLQRNPQATPELMQFLQDVVDDPDSILSGLRGQPAEADYGVQLQNLVDCIQARHDRLLHLHKITDDPDEFEDWLDLPDDEDDEDFVDQQSFDFGEGELEDETEAFYALAPGMDISLLEDDWHDIYPVDKPISTQPVPHITDDPWAPDVFREWLEFLYTEPDAFNSFDIIDDMLSLLAIYSPSDTVSRQSYEPLLKRGVALLDHALANSPIEDVELHWFMAENRPVLRTFIRYAAWLLDADENDAANERFWQYLRLNPQDNHGVRQILANGLLQAGDDDTVLTLCARFTDDIMPEIAFGRVLAHYRQGELGAAADALHAANQTNPHIISTLRNKQAPQPPISEHGITVGGMDQAWLYREQMRDLWVATPGLLDWAHDELKNA